MNLKATIGGLKRQFIYGLRRTYWKPRLKHLGKNVRIEKGVIIVNPKVVSIGDHSWIDKYTIIEGGKGIEIGRYVHIVTFCHIQGGGIVKIGDYVAIASGTKIYSDTNYYTKRMSGALPLDQQDIKAGQVTIGKDAFIGLNSVVLPGVTIGEGAVIGAGSVVNRDIPSWSVAIGLPARVVNQRPKHNLPDI